MPDKAPYVDRLTLADVVLAAIALALYAPGTIRRRIRDLTRS